MAVGIETLLAAAGLVVCVVLLAGMALGPARVARLRARLQTGSGRSRGTLRRWRAALRRALHWRRDRAQARREAEAAIERVKRRVDRDGNVYRPRAFGDGERRPDEPLH